MQGKFSISRMSMVISLCMVLLFTFAVVTPVHAAEINNGGVLAAGQTVDDDLFLSGESVSMDGTVNGMLFAAGTTVTINGTVNGDVVAMGNRVVVSDAAIINGNLFSGASVIEVNGQVKGSLFGGSSSIVVGSTAAVERNLFYGGYSLETKAGSTVGKDLYSGTYQSVLAGDVSRDVNICAGAVELKGKITRNARLDVGNPSEDQPMMFMPMFQQPGMPPAIKGGLRIDPKASIGGKLTYTSTVDQASAIQAQPAGGVVYQTPAPESKAEAKPQPITVRYPVLGWLWKFFRNLITLWILGGLALWLIPRLLERVKDEAERKPLPSAGYGLLTIIVGYAAIGLTVMVLLLLVVIVALLALGPLSSTLAGLGFSALALTGAVFSLLISYGSKVAVSYLIGRLVMKGLLPKASHANIWAMVIGVFLYALVRAIPFLGWVVGVIVTIVGVGAMWLAWQNRKAAPVVEVPAA